MNEQGFGARLGTYRQTAGGARASRILQGGCITLGSVFVGLAALALATNPHLGWHFVLGGFALISVGWALWSWWDQRSRRASEFQILSGGVRLKRGAIVRSVAWGDVGDLRPLTARARPNPVFRGVLDGAVSDLPARWVLEVRGDSNIILDLRHWQDSVGMMQQLASSLQARQ